MESSNFSLFLVVLIFVTSCYFLFPLSNSSSINEERQALLHSGWWNDYKNTSMDQCKLYGIICNGARSVTHIYSPYLIIPQSKKLRLIQDLNVTAFPSLVNLHLNGMGLKGSIPIEISTLTKLTYLDLSYNHLQGKVRSIALTNVTILLVALSLLNYRYLFLAFHQIAGSIPVELGNLTQLVELSLNNNSLTGPIPSTLGQLKNLVHLVLDSNHIQGNRMHLIKALSNLDDLL